MIYLQCYRDVYYSFCKGHFEAQDIILKVQMVRSKFNSITLYGADKSNEAEEVALHVQNQLVEYTYFSDAFLSDFLISLILMFIYYTQRYRPDVAMLVTCAAYGQTLFFLLLCILLRIYCIIKIKAVNILSGEC